MLSHLHGDHFGGLPFLILDGQFSRRTRPLVVAGPPGVGPRVEAAMEVLFPGSTRVTRRFAVEFVELGAREASALGPATVTAFPVEHAAALPPMRSGVQYGGTVIVYSGDTGWAESLAEAARGADLFVCEAYTFDRPIRHHLDYRTLAAHLPQIGCRRLTSPTWARTCSRAWAKSTWSTPRTAISSASRPHALGNAAGVPKALLRRVSLLCEGGPHRELASPARASPYRRRYGLQVWRPSTEGHVVFRQVRAAFAGSHSNCTTP